MYNKLISSIVPNHALPHTVTPTLDSTGHLIVQWQPGGGAAEPKCGMGGQKWKNCVESCGYKMGVKIVRVGVIWV